MSLVTHVSYGIAAAAGLASGQLGYACLAVALVVMVGAHLGGPTRPAAGQAAGPMTIQATGRDFTDGQPLAGPRANGPAGQPPFVAAAAGDAQCTVAPELGGRGACDTGELPCRR